MAIIDIEDDSGKKPNKSRTQLLSPPETSNTSTYVPPSWDTLLSSLGNTASFGLAPKLGAALSTGLGKIAPDAFGTQSYEERLRDINAVNAAGAQANPIANVTGSVVGGLATAPILGTGGLAAQAAKGAAAGAVNAYGASEKSGADLAKDIAQGGALGGATSAVLPAIGAGVKGFTSLAKGSSDKTKLGEALQEFSKRPVPPTANETAPGAARAAWQELNNPDVLASDLVRGRFGSRATPEEIYRAMLRENPNIVSEDTLREVVAQHNRANRFEPVKHVLRNAAAGAAVGGLGAGVTSGGDIENTVYGALGGAGTGALGGLAAAARSPKARLTMPGENAPHPNADKFTPLNAAKTIATQAANRELANTLDVPASPFGKISDYFRSVQGTEKEPSDEVARLADQILMTQDPDEKRRLAMELQKYQSGRAASNTDAKNR